MNEIRPTADLGIKVYDDLASAWIAQPEIIQLASNKQL